MNSNVGVFWMVILPIFRSFRHYQQDSLRQDLWCMYIQYDDVARISNKFTFHKPLLTVVLGDLLNNGIAKMGK